MGVVMRFKKVENGKITNIVLFDSVESAAYLGYVPALDTDVIHSMPMDEKTAALAKLAAIDAESGMNRLLRETLRALAGDKAPARLIALEADAAAERAKLEK